MHARTLTAVPPLQGGTSGGGDGAGDLGGPESLDGVVGEVSDGQGAGLDGVGAATEVDIVDGDVANLVRVLGEDGLFDAGERGTLEEDLGAHAGVDAAGVEVLLVVVDDVDGLGEPDRRAAAVDVLPVVVGLCRRTSVSKQSWTVWRSVESKNLHR